MQLKSDCRHFPGDRPCAPHKQQGFHCPSCPHYRPVGHRSLIVMAGKLSNVLRATSLLPSLKARHPDTELTWLTHRRALPIFENNPLVDRLLAYEEPTTLASLKVEYFDYLLQPAVSLRSSALGALVQADRRKGFILDSKGRILPLDQSARAWLEQAAFDDVKRRNTRTYQQIVHAMAGFEFRGAEMMLALSEAERAYGREFLERKGLGGRSPLFGIQTGGGKRWRYKRWHLAGFEELVLKLLREYADGRVLLFGGSDEAEVHGRLASLSDRVVETGRDGGLRELFTLLGLVDVVVTGDTLTLHAATALGKQVVGLFGPTSAAEVEDYGRVTKVQPELDCLVCYRKDCDLVPNCMESISADQVLTAVRGALEQLSSG